LEIANLSPYIITRMTPGRADFVGFQ
jgi:hypothetical protein